MQVKKPGTQPSSKKSKSTLAFALGALAAVVVSAVTLRSGRFAGFRKR